MMIETSGNMLIFLLATTVLGAVIGYCVAVILSKKRAAAVIAEMQSDLEKRKQTANAELASAQKGLTDLQNSLSQTNDRANAALQREEALEVHAQLQAQRLQTLESQVSSYEDQQIRLQRDFASYKSNKSRELELARSKPDGWSEASQLPVLKRRIDDQDELLERSENAAGQAPSGKVAPGERQRCDRVGLSTPLSRELDIPSLSESELPDSVDELEFELIDMDGSGEWPRG